MRVVELNGGEEDNNSFLFKSGYDATVQERVSAGDWELVADQHVPGWDNQEALTIMEQILVDQNNGVDAVFAANDGLAASAANAIEAAGIGPLPISGQDATAEGMQNVLLGRQTMSVYKPIQDEAGLASAVASRCAPVRISSPRTSTSTTSSSASRRRRGSRPKRRKVMA